VLPDLTKRLERFQVADCNRIKIMRKIREPEINNNLLFSLKKRNFSGAKVLIIRKKKRRIRLEDFIPT